jgi:hypothetical protein
MEVTAFIKKKDQSLMNQKLKLNLQIPLIFFETSKVQFLKTFS